MNRAAGIPDRALRIARRVIAGADAAQAQSRELAAVALLELSATPAGDGLRAPALALARSLRPAAAPWDHEPFDSLTWTLATAAGDRALAAGFVAATRTMMREAPRRSDGVLLHPRSAAGDGGHGVRLGTGIEQVRRLARAFALTGDLAFAGAWRQQVHGLRELLRDPRSGLWSEGVGRLPAADARPPGAWSRGHGRLMRGLVDAASVVPRGPLRDELAGLVEETACVLLPLQDRDGFRHALPCRPPHAGAGEPSGTALIAGAFLRAVARGLLPQDPYAASGRRALEAVLRQVDEDGVVHGACPGPGPLAAGAASHPGDEHGAFAVLGACAAAADLDRRRGRGRGVRPATRTLAAASRAFSLLELLVVITAVAILATLLLPTITAVRENSRGLKCLANLRQLGVFATEFREMNGGRYPGGGQTASGSVAWHAIIDSEVLAGQGVDTALFGSAGGMNCPSFRQKAPSYKRPYSLNGDLCSTVNGLVLADPASRNRAYIAYHLGILGARVVSPSTKVLFQDTENNNGSVLDTWPCFETAPAACWSFYRSPIGQGMIANGGQCAFRHAGGMPSTYVDLHADVRRPDRELNSQKRYRYNQ